MVELKPGGCEWQDDGAAWLCLAEGAYRNLYFLVGLGEVRVSQSVKDVGRNRWYSHSENGWRIEQCRE